MLHKTIVRAHPAVIVVVRWDAIAQPRRALESVRAGRLAKVPFERSASVRVDCVLLGWFTIMALVPEEFAQPAATSR